MRFFNTERLLSNGNGAMGRHALAKNFLQCNIHRKNVAPR